jgi:hypothetical protein
MKHYHFKTPGGVARVNFPINDPQDGNFNAEEYQKALDFAIGISEEMEYLGISNNWKEYYRKILN